MRYVGFVHGRMEVNALMNVIEELKLYRKTVELVATTGELDASIKVLITRFEKPRHTRGTQGTRFSLHIHVSGLNQNIIHNFLHFLKSLL